MLSDIENVRKMVELLGDEGFVAALTNAEQLVDDVDETLGRVEQVEDEAAEAVREANEALNAVDSRLQRFDETIRLIEAKIEAGFSVGFFFFALQQWTAGAVFLATGLFVMGLLGVSSLAVTIATMPQIQRLRQVGGALTSRLGVDDDAGGDEPGERSEPRIDWQTTDQEQRGRQTGESRRDRQTGDTQDDRGRRNQQAGDGQSTRQTRRGDPDGQTAQSNRGRASDDQRAESGGRRDRTTGGGNRRRRRDRAKGESETRERTDTDDDRRE